MGVCRQQKQNKLDSFSVISDHLNLTILIDYSRVLHSVNLYLFHIFPPFPLAMAYDYGCSPSQYYSPTSNNNLSSTSNNNGGTFQPEQNNNNAQTKLQQQQRNRAANQATTNSSNLHTTSHTSIGPNNNQVR